MPRSPGWFNSSLEGMIPDQFERKKTLTDLWAKLRAKFYPDL